jgi:hypothetical protein
MDITRNKESDSYSLELEAWVVGCTIGSIGEIPGERKPAIRCNDYDDNNKNNSIFSYLVILFHRILLHELTQFVLTRDFSFWRRWRFELRSSGLWLSVVLQQFAPFSCYIHETRSTFFP